MARNENGKGFSLKDALFNQNKVAYLAQCFANADPQFDAASFEKKVMTKLRTLELKERIVWIATVLEEQLPKDFSKSASIIVRALPPPLDPNLRDDDFGDFIFAPLGEYVVRNGLSSTHLHRSLQTLQAITQRFSMEDAIRYFLNEFEAETMTELHTWTSHRHYHVRRLASEGTRPLLPWSGRIKLSIEKTIPLLNELYYDPTRYVTRSVANHMNDIAKKNPELALATLKRWQVEGKQDPVEMDWITRHSLRTLVKLGNRDALELLGYDASVNVSVDTFKLVADEVLVGESFDFTFSITAETSAELMVDYVIDFQKANGKRGEKVFKLKKLAVQGGKKYELKKSHAFPADATTLTFYPGHHTITLQINGIRLMSQSFQLKS